VPDTDGAVVTAAQQLILEVQVAHRGNAVEQINGSGLEVRLFDVGVISRHGRFAVGLRKRVCSLQCERACWLMHRGPRGALSSVWEQITLSRSAGRARLCSTLASWPTQY
jgi:hypothetical protein